jgi:Xaa-Pro aminopeptidase
MDEQKVFQNRLTQVRQAMRDQGLQTLLVHDAGRHNFLRMNYVAYLTDFISVGPDTMLVIPLDDAPVLYLTPPWDIPRAQEESQVGEVRPFQEFHARLGKLSGRVGLIGREAMHVGLHDEIVKALGQSPANSKDIIETMARCKGPFELERMRRAASIADAGVRALHQDARPGLKEYELAAIVEYKMRSLGAEDNFGMVVANHHNQALHPPTDRVVQRGDIIIGEITPCR